jgi:glycosyltransferase involved in cell wall biosynthesis
MRSIDLARIQKLEKRVAADIEAGEYDLVYVHPCRFENSPSVLRYLNRFPTLFFCQEPLRILYEQMPERPYDRRDSTTKRILNRIDPLPGLYYRTLRNNDLRNIHNASCVLVNSEFMKEAVSAIYGVDPEVSYLGVDIEFFHPNGAAKQDFLLSVGSLTPLKGFDFIIRALAHIPPAMRPPLKIISNFANPQEKEYLEDLGHRLGIDLEISTGVSEEGLRTAYNQAALTVYAPIREPFGLVAIESMACGTPVVAVREGGIQETVVDGSAGRLISRDEGMFAEIVQGLLADPARREELGRHGRSLVETTWSWDLAVERLEASFQNLSQHQSQ